MKKHSTKLLAVVTMLTTALIISCQREEVDTMLQSTPPPTTQSVICGTTQTQTLLAGQFINAGTVSVSNDQTNLYVTYTAAAGWYMTQTHLYVGNCDSVPVNNSGNPTIGLFPYTNNHSPAVTTFTYTIPLSSLHDSCYCIAAHAAMEERDANGNVLQTQTGWGQGDPMGGNSWAMKFSYCTQSCTITPPPADSCVINPGDYRTQTQGGWGATPQGNNPAMYLQNNFASAFPSGVTIGCASGYSLTFTSSQAVNTFLPEGGTAAVLTQNGTDVAPINNVFAGQVLTLAISVGMDNAIPSFSASSTPLASMIIASGTFQGWTIGQLLQEANNALGGCSSTYTLSDLNAAVTAVNENFDNGTVVGTYITCP